MKKLLFLLIILSFVVPSKILTKEKSNLSKDGIIKWTNYQRKKFRIPPLKENPILNKSAKLRLEDMFKYEYFGHVSPKGAKLEDFIKKAGYEYVIIGENLAKGNFKSSKEVIEILMKSSKHRKNILEKEYKEIGVALKKGIFKGETVWIVVQHFGKPLHRFHKSNLNLINLN